MEQIPESVQQDKQYLHERTKHISADLKSTLGPVLSQAALDTIEAAAHIADQHTPSPMFWVPNNLSAIPPDFFGTSLPRTFDSLAEFDKHTEAYYEQSRDTLRRPGDGSPWTTNMEDITKRGLRRVLHEQRELTSFDGWDRYSAYAPKQHLHDHILAFNACCVSLAHPQAEESGFLENFTSQNEASFITPTQQLEGYAGNSSITRCQIMQDNEGFTRAFLDACAMVSRMVNTHMSSIEKYEKILSNPEQNALVRLHIQRANPRGNGEVDVKSLRRMAHEGVQTGAATIALLMRDQPEGYPFGPEQLLSDIVQQNLIEKFARLTPFGIVVPSALFGRYIPNPLYAAEVPGRGYRLQFTVDAKRQLREYSDIIASKYAEERRNYDAFAAAHNLFDPRDYRAQWELYANLLPHQDAHLPSVEMGTRCVFIGKDSNPGQPAALVPGAITNYGLAISAVFRALHVEK